MPLPKPGQYDTFTETLRNRALGSTTVGFLGAATPLTIDVSQGGPEYFFYLNSAASVTSMTLSNPVDGQVITIMVFKTLGASSITWPANVRWAGGVAPAMTTNTCWSFIQLRYFSSDNMWREMSRSLNVPN